MNKMCCECGKAPRKVSRSGVTLTKCEPCQQKYWRDKKRAEQGYLGMTGDAPVPRRDKTERPPRKPYGRGKAIELPGSKPLPPEGLPPPRPVRRAIVVVDRANNRFLMCEHVSETPVINELTIPHVIRFYQTLGYRVVDGVEEVQNVEQAAGD